MVLVGGCRRVARFDVGNLPNPRQSATRKIHLPQNKIPAPFEAGINDTHELPWKMDARPHR
jgi:hypothetical protein